MRGYQVAEKGKEFQFQMPQHICLFFLIGDRLCKFKMVDLLQSRRLKAIKRNVWSELPYTLAARGKEETEQIGSIQT